MGTDSRDADKRPLTGMDALTTPVCPTRTPGTLLTCPPARKDR